MALIIKRSTEKNVDEKKELNDTINKIEKSSKTALDSIDKINRTLINVLR